MKDLLDTFQLINSRGAEASLMPHLPQNEHYAVAVCIYNPLRQKQITDQNICPRVCLQ
jgi:hypothetical protein